ncbi:MAG: Hint domain-containing protein [Sulfitobacter sp.]
MATINGTDQTDSIPGTVDSDLIAAGKGHDTISGGDGNDTLLGEDGNDFIFGGDGADSISGGEGFDDIFGGDGDDIIDGGTGADLINGGAGADTLSGGNANDIFYNVGAGDVIDGGEEGNADFDRIDLEGSAPDGGSFKVVFDADNPENGTVKYVGVNGKDAGKIVFKNIEKVVPCFTPGTRIATPHGEVLVQDLNVGDRVVTRDNGLQTIRWIGKQVMLRDDFEDAPHLAPIQIAKGALGNDLPERDMMVSPNHRMLVANDKTALYFEEREVLVAAKHLTGLPKVSKVMEVDTTYIHLMFDQHEVILSDGTWSESFQPGVQSLAGVGNAQRLELFEIFPELTTHDGVKSYASARRSLKAHEASLLAK